jgi:putative ABC transport system permease protein
MAWVKIQLRQVLRSLGRAPLFTVVVLLTLAVGIGANTAIFSVVNGILLKPLPYLHPEELVAVWLSAPGINIKDLNLALADYLVFREQNRTFQDIGLYMGYTVNITGSGEPEQASGLLVTDGVLPVLGATPLLGRTFTQADDQQGSADTVMLTYGYWHRKFGSDPSAVGKVISVAGKPHQILGVLRQNFHFGGPNLALLFPIKFDRDKTFLLPFNYDAVARLRPGVTVAGANTDVARMLPIVLRSFPPPPGYSLKMFDDARMEPNLRTLKQHVVGDVGKLLWVLMGGIGFVLLIACANVANLLLVRAQGRHQELAIRAALGATPGRIAAELLFENLVLALVGGVLGVALAYAALRVLIAMAPSGLPRLQEIGIDGPTLLFSLAASLVASLLFGSVPVLKYAGKQVGTGLRQGGRSMSEGRERHRSRSVLIVVQVALAVVLLISSGLMIRTFHALTTVDPGFAAPEQLQTFRVNIPDADAKDPERVVRMQEEILRKIEAVPGVSSVGLSMSVPMDGNGWEDTVFVKDRKYSPGEIPLHRFRFVAPRFFKTLGTPFLAGRDFTWGDIYNKVPLAIISEKLARENWHDPSLALGKQIRANEKDDWREVIGVVRDVHDDGVDKEAPSSVYWPILAAHFTGTELDVRRYVAYSIRSRRASSESFMTEVRRAVWSVDPNLPLADVHTLDYFYRTSMARTSFTLVMLAIAGSMALLLGIVGLYGVIAYSVSQRRREIGIRSALGAQQRELTGMFVRHAMWLTGAGVTCGLVAALVLTRLMASLLFGIKPTDPATFAVVSIGLLSAAAVSSYLPARRTAAVNPVEALRAE